jgi:hypothetical protein
MSIPSGLALASQPRLHLLNCFRLPARLSAEEAAYMLGFQEHDIPVLVKAKLLKPLGSPAQAAPKWFAAAEIEVLSRDPKFLAKATDAVSARWRNRNTRVKQSAKPMAHAA